MSVRRFHGVGMAFLAVSMMSGGVAVSAQGNPGQGSSGTLPDAQIESNVLRALASAPELSSQNIQTSTVYGTVTFTGNVQDEAMRTKAENLAARAQGVQKVVDELVLGDTPPAPAGDQATQGVRMALRPVACRTDRRTWCCSQTERMLQPRERRAYLPQATICRTVAPAPGPTADAGPELAAS